MGVHLPAWLSAGPLALGGAEGGFINLPAMIIALLVTGLLIVGTSESAKVNAVLVMIKITALTAFVALTYTSPEFSSDKFNPFLPAGIFGGFGTGVGAVGAAATIFFAYVGFDSVSTAAEETKNPQRNVPIGLIGSLLICTVFYIVVAGGAIATVGGQPIMGADMTPLAAGSPELARQCAMPEHAEALVCSNEALAHVLRVIGFSGVGNMLGVAAFLALPLGHSRVAVRSDPHLLRDEPGRPAAREAEHGASALQDAAHRDGHDRRPRRHRRGFLPGRPAGGHLEQLARCMRLCSLRSRC